MPRLVNVAICCPAILIVGLLTWLVADQIAHPYPLLTPVEESLLERVIENHRFSEELHINEFGLPYHTSTIAPEAHALFLHKPLAMLHLLRGQVAEADAKTSLRAAAIALEAGKESYSVTLYYVMEQDFDKDSIAGSTRRDWLLSKIDDRIKKIAADERKTKVAARRTDRGTLGRECQAIEEADPTELVVVELVETSQGKGYWMR